MLDKLSILYLIEPELVCYLGREAAAAAGTDPAPWICIFVEGDQHLLYCVGCKGTVYSILILYLRGGGEGDQHLLRGL